MNRLKLNWTLSTAEQRKEFLDKYIQSEQFKYIPLNTEELEMCANYVLFGKDKNGLNGIQRKEFKIQTKHSTWNEQEVESLDMLMESPAFNEGTIVQPTEARYKVVKENFSRSKALKEAPSDMVKIFEQLFKEIDEIDLLINYYDLEHNKRKNPPRDMLLKVIPEERQVQLKEKAKHLNMYQYLKMRHQLVELRRQQYSLRDSYATCITVDPIRKTPLLNNKMVMGADFTVLPFGIKHNNHISDKLFSNFDNLNPTNFTDVEIEQIIKNYWQIQNNITKVWFDFSNNDHLVELINLMETIEDTLETLEVEDTLREFYDTFWYYVENADLSDCQREILNLKIHHIKNSVIAEYVNKKYNKSYTVNYISTIFRQKIIKKISECVTYHQEIVLNLPYPEEFKQCSTCKQYYLRDPRNFVKKTRSKDGFTSRCKKCDRKERERKR